MAGHTESKKSVADRILESLQKAPKTVMTKIADDDETLFTRCETCDTLMEKIAEYVLGCPNCKTSMDLLNTGEYTLGSGDHYGCSSNAFTSFRPTGGSHSQMYMHTMVKTTSNSEAFRGSQLLDIIKTYNNNSRDFRLPLDVIHDAIELFRSLRDVDFVRRGTARRGMIGACLYAACQKAGVSKTQSQIAIFMSVDESKISQGISDLQRYNSQAFVVIPHNYDPSTDYMASLFEMFELKTELHLAFASAMLERIGKKRTPGIWECFIKSKCVAILWGLNVLYRYGITHDQIHKNCENISKNTYINIWKAIETNRATFERVFTKHNVPLPDRWRA